MSFIDYNYIKSKTISDNYNKNNINIRNKANNKKFNIEDKLSTNNLGSLEQLIKIVDICAIDRFRLERLNYNIYVFKTWLYTLAKI